jgi:hypothetical protein
MYRNPGRSMLKEPKAQHTEKDEDVEIVEDAEMDEEEVVVAEDLQFQLRWWQVAHLR